MQSQFKVSEVEASIWMKKERSSKPWWANAGGGIALSRSVLLGQIRTKGKKLEVRVASWFFGVFGFFGFFATNCLMGVNLSLMWCSRLFGCYNFSSVSCCKTHRLCLRPGLHPSCETLISGTHSSIASLADACCLVSSPAGSWLRSWCSPGTTNNRGTLVILEMGLQQCSLGGPQCPVLFSAHFPEPGEDLSPGCLGIKALLRLCDITPGTWNRAVHHVVFCECTLPMFFAEPCVLTARWLINYGAS